MSSLLCEHSALYSETWPISGIMLDGLAFEQPTPARRMEDSESSSQPGRPAMLLWTPDTVPDIPNTQSNLRARKGPGIPPKGLGNQAEYLSLLPTPSASNPNDGESVESWKARQATERERLKNGNGMGMPLSIAMRDIETSMPLMPTPRTSDANGAEKVEERESPQLRTIDQLIAGAKPRRSKILATPTTSAATGSWDPPHGTGSNLQAQIGDLLPTPTTESDKASGESWASESLIDKIRRLEQSSTGDPMLPLFDAGSW